MTSQSLAHKTIQGNVNFEDRQRLASELSVRGKFRAFAIVRMVIVQGISMVGILAVAGLVFVPTRTALETSEAAKSPDFWRAPYSEQIEVEMLAPNGHSVSSQMSYDELRDFAWPAGSVTRSLMQTAKEVCSGSQRNTTWDTFREVRVTRRISGRLFSNEKTMTVDFEWPNGGQHIRTRFTFTCERRSSPR